LGDVAQIAIVAFSGDAQLVNVHSSTIDFLGSTTPLADRDGDGERDVDRALKSLRSGGGTNFEAGLNEVINAINAELVQAGDVNVVFLSDGNPGSGGAFDDEVQILRDDLGANVRALGVGSGISLASLQLIDPDAVTFANEEELLAAFGAAGTLGGTLLPGDYLLQIAPTNFNDGLSLESSISSTGNNVGGKAPDPTNAVDNDDNGDPVEQFGVVSRAVTLSLDSKSVGDGSNSSNNLSLDFGFVTTDDTVVIPPFDEPRIDVIEPVVNTRTTPTEVPTTTTEQATPVTLVQPIGFELDEGSAGKATPQLNIDSPTRLITTDGKLARELLSIYGGSSREQVTDALFYLVDNEQVMLLAIDMGDELVPPQREKRQQAPPVIVEKPKTELHVTFPKPILPAKLTSDLSIQEYVIGSLTTIVLLVGGRWLRRRKHKRTTNNNQT